MNLAEVATIVLGACLIVAAAVLANVSVGTRWRRLGKAVLLAAVAFLGVLLFGAKLAHAGGNRVTYILAYVQMHRLEESRPQFIAPMFSREQCLVEAEKRNRTDENLRDPAVRQLGGEFVCLKIERALV